MLATYISPAMPTVAAVMVIAPAMDCESIDERSAAGASATPLNARTMYTLLPQTPTTLSASAASGSHDASRHALVARRRAIQRPHACNTSETET